MVAPTSAWNRRGSSPVSNQWLHTSRSGHRGADIVQAVETLAPQSRRKKTCEDLGVSPRMGWRAQATKEPCKGSRHAGPSRARPIPEGESTAIRNRLTSPRLRDQAPRAVNAASLDDLCSRDLTTWRGPRTQPYCYLAAMTDVHRRVAVGGMVATVGSAPQHRNGYLKPAVVKAYPLAS